MDNGFTQSFVDMAFALAQLAVKGTASAIQKKVTVAKEIKDINQLRNVYDEIISELLQEREEAIRIAQAYKSEYERISISDDDIIHLHNTVERILTLIKQTQIAGATILGTDEVDRVTKQTESYDQIIKLISVDTLKTMQLLGFNYKAAIGEPLTTICANAILSFGAKKAGQQQSKNGKR